MHGRYSVSISSNVVHDGQANDSLPPLTVVSGRQPTLPKAQEEVCQVALASLLSVGADQIWFVPGTLHHGQPSVALLRKAGRKVSQAAGPPASGTWREWMQQLAPIGPTQVTQSLV